MSVFEGEAPSLRKETLYQQAYEALKRAIMEGRLQPGHAVSLRSLASELNVSQMPVRDALNRLVTQRALELLPNRTVRVPFMTRDKFGELAQVRCYLEGQIARLAVSAMPKNRIRELSDKNEQMKLAAGEGAVAEFLQLNFEFHFLLYEHARSEIMLPMIESLWLQAGPFLNEYIKARGFGAAGEHHEEIIVGVRQGDAERVGLAVEADIEDAAAAVLEYALSRA